MGSGLAGTEFISLSGTALSGNSFTSIENSLL